MIKVFVFSLGLPLLIAFSLLAGKANSSCEYGLETAAYIFLGIAALPAAYGLYIPVGIAMRRARARAAAEREAARFRELNRPKLLQLQLFRPPTTDKDLVVALTKPDDVGAELQRFALWKESPDGRCPRCLGTGKIDIARPKRQGQRTRVSPRSTGKVLGCGCCEVCYFCEGSGTTEKQLKDLEPPEAFDDQPCQICFCESRFRVARDCDHFYCKECLGHSLEAILDQGQFPAFCPGCRAESMGKQPTKGKIETNTLTFLSRRGVITKDFQFRFLVQQLKDNGEKFFRCPADGCGNWLLEMEPGRVIRVEPIGQRQGNDADQTEDVPMQIKREPKIGLAPCGAAVCLVCHQELPRFVTPEDVKELEVDMTVMARLPKSPHAPPHPIGAHPARQQLSLRLNVGGGQRDRFVSAKITGVFDKGATVLPADWDEYRSRPRRSEGRMAQVAPATSEAVSIDHGIQLDIEQRAEAGVFVNLDNIRVALALEHVAHDCPEDIIGNDELDEQSKAEMAKIGKPCPHCGAFTQKTDGCNFMVCAHCRKSWCWETGKPRYGKNGCGGGHNCH